MSPLKISSSVFTRILSVLCLAGVALANSAAFATVAQTPLYLVQAVKPDVLLTMSNDHQLYYKAYDDYSDIDGDGTADTTYKNSVDYYGYFDSYKCYTYDTTNKRFTPSAITATKYCSGNWSGNFLNWATMTRIDTVRKILYGGYRSTDTASLTVLERSFLPHDAHSFAKYYSGSDIPQLTPFSNTEITMCNTTASSSSTAYSQNVTDPPLMRVAAGNFKLWAANERWQCRWREEQNTNNSNDPALSGINAAYYNPYKTSGDSNGDGINPDAIGEKDYNVRVEVCNSSYLGKENCKRYPNGNYKPVGLLQNYGDTGNINFGLMTGSYAKSKSGGVLRKKIGPITDEINVDTDGTLKATPAAGSIITTINKLRLYGYYYGDGTYNHASPGDNCNWGMNSFSNGQCSNWGNPQSEMFLEALRYLAGKNANSSFNCDDSTRISGLKTATWSDPLPPAKAGDNWCTPLNIIDFNASTSSYDNDELSSASDIGITNLASETDKIGDAEGITGNSYFIGKNGTNNNGLCTAKTVSALSAATGTCPDAPRLDGSYAIAGLAGYARTNSIRTDLGVNEQKVTTYGVALSPAVPKLELPVPGSTTGQKVTILPACQDTWNSDAVTPGNCTIVDFKIVTPYTLNGAGDTATGKVYVNWEDSEQGGDYDQDMWGTLEYTITNTQVTVVTDVHAQSTPYRMAFGYVIGGTKMDGFHAHSGINGYNYTDPYAGVAHCSNCLSGDAATSQSYLVDDGTAPLAQSLQQPLWYAAKWGGFKEDPKTANNVLDNPTEWDANSDGIPDRYFYATNPAQLEKSLSAAFLAVADTKSSYASVAANSVTLSTDTAIYQASFNSGNWTGTVLAKPLDANGNVATTPAWSAATAVDAANYDTGRTIFTYDPVSKQGKAFRWSSLTAAQQALMNIDPVTLATDTKGSARLNYIRGDVSQELRNGTGTFRDRDSRLGDIVDSTPNYVAAVPGFNYPDDFINVSDTSSYYSAFRNTIQTMNSGTGRIPMLYVGANDGMLHGFRADTGAEVFAYVPNQAIATLPNLTNISYSHKYYVNGEPTSGDAYGSFPGCAAAPSPCWRTELVGGMAAGGKAIFAMDVTDPSQISESNPTKSVLWEISNTTTGFSDLGYTFSRPSIVHMASGDWAVIFGNGYNAASGKAVLYIVNAVTGAQIVSPIVLETSATNGLSTVAPVDKDGNGTVDYLYAGDLKGNVWKIDVSSSNKSQWGTAFKQGSTPKPLFVAKDSSGVVQPIMALTEVGKHKTGNGFMIYFGTGKYFEDGDNDPAGPAGTQLQTFYGIWDKDDGTYGFTRSDLLQQVVVAEFYNQTYTSFSGTYGFDLRQTSNYQMNWRVSGATTPNYLGWYIDLIDPAHAFPGERVIDPAILDRGRIIFNTIIPSLKACDFGGTYWLMELDAESGAYLDPIPPWDLNGDGMFDSSDYIQSINTPPGGKRNSTGTGMTRKPLIIQAGNKEYKYASGTKNATIEMTVESVSGGGKGRTSWRQLR